MDIGNFNVGKKVSAFFGGDNYDEAYGNLVAAFGEPPAAEIIGHLFELTTEDAFANLRAGGLVGGSAPSATTAAAPAGPVCTHGARTYVEGQSAKGPWKAWMCPLPKNTPGKCAPEWIK